MAKRSSCSTKQNTKETDNNEDDGSSVSVDSTLLLHLTVVFKFIFCSYFVRTKNNYCDASHHKTYYYYRPSRPTVSMPL